MAEVCRLEARLVMNEGVLRHDRFVEWLEYDEGLMGEDSNNVLDWEGNNIE